MSAQEMRKLMEAVKEGWNDATMGAGYGESDRIESEIERSDLRKVLNPKEITHVAQALVDDQEINSNIFDKLVEFYLNTGEMPVGVAKARTGDPYQWVYDKLESEFLLDSYDDKFGHDGIVPGKE